MSGAITHPEYDNEVEKLRQHLFDIADDKPHWAEFLEAWEGD